MPETALILGASENPMRYSHMATLMLLEYGHNPVLVGKSGMEVVGIPIHRGIPEDFSKPETITLYINPMHQQAWIDKIIGLQPVRVIFNPGTENPEFMKKLDEANIPYLQACTLVMQRAGQY